MNAAVQRLLRHIAQFLLLAAAAPALADEGEPIPSETVTLEVRNASTTPIRCSVVLAHFITRDVPAFRPGESRRIALGRDLATGVLAYGEHNGAPMYVENILCGAVTDWDARHADLVLTALRSDAAPYFVADCTGTDPFICAVSVEQLDD